MVVGFLRGNSSQQQQAQQPPAYVQDPAQTIAMHHHHLQLQASMAAASSSASANRLGSLNSNHAMKRPFQELPRLHVPPHALAQQAQPMLKTGSVIMPSSLGLVSGGNSPPPPPPAGSRFQFLSNVGGWFGRNNAPAKALPSFHEILARTNQLQIVGNTNNNQQDDSGDTTAEGAAQDDPLQDQQQQQMMPQEPPHMMSAAADIDMNTQQQQQHYSDPSHQQEQQQMQMQQHMQQQQAQQLQMQMHMHHEQQQLQLQQMQQMQQPFAMQQPQQPFVLQQQQQPFAMQFPPSAAPPSYTAFAPQTISLQTNDHLAQRPSLHVMSNYSNNNTGAIEAPSPMSLASPAASQTSVDASKRRERWTEDEHARFMEGLNRYGRKWKKIQTFVQTKTAVQVRTHAYGYFAKLLRNMPEDDGVWELAEEMSSLPGAVLKGPGNGKRRNEPKTDEQGMDVLRRFVFSKKKADDKKAASESGDMNNNAMDTTTDDSSSNQTQTHETPYVNWSIVVEDSAASSAMLELKRQRIN